MADLVTSRRQTRALQSVPRESSDFFPFDGGLNLIDSPLSSTPGQLSSGLNYEIDIQGGYRRIGGYESYDGSPGPSDESYWKMPFGAIERPLITLSTGVVGGSSATTGAYLDFTEEGGYGRNHVENNEVYDNADWDMLQIAASDSIVDIIDGDIAATTEHPQLSKLTEATGLGNGVHGIEMATAESVAIGDIAYVSWYFKPGAGTGSLLQIVGSGWFASGGPGLQVYGDGSISLGQGLDTWGPSGWSVTLLSDGAYKCEFWTDMNGIAASDIKLTFKLLNAAGQGVHDGTGAHIWLGGLQMTILRVGEPMNLIQGLDLSTWSATSGTLSITDNDLVPFNTPTGGATLFPAGGSKLTDLTAPGGDPANHEVRTSFIGNPTPVKVRAGDRIYVEWYSAYTAGQIDIHTIRPDPNYSYQTFGGLFDTGPKLFVDISTGTLKSDGLGDAIDDYDIRLIQTTPEKIYRISFVTIPALLDDEFGWYFAHAVDNAGFTARSYISTGLYSHIAGFRCFAMSDDRPMAANDGHQFPYGYVKNPTAKNNYVDTGGLILSGVSSDYTVDEDLEVGGTKVMEARDVAVENGETDAALDAAYAALAASIATAAVAPVGEGAIRGVWEYNGTYYCFRDNVGATAGQMFKATPSGWSLIALNERLGFDAGTGTEPAIGDTVTGAGGANAPIRRVVTTSGTWGVDAAGYLILGTVTAGPFVNDESLTFATADGVNAAQTLAAGGRYEFRNNNFYGASDWYRMYGVSGVGMAFEYDDDPTTGFYCEIETGMVLDTPNHLAVHNFHLFLSFPGGSVQLSADGDPVNWSVIFGASEIAIGADCTGFNEEVGNSLFIFSRHKTFVLQGNTRANFDLDDFNINAGAHEWSLDRIGMGCYLDDRGFTTLLQTQRSGSVNFEENAVSTLIQPLIADLIGSTSVLSSHLIKNRNIYRCYFADGRVVSIAFREHQVSGHMTLEYPFAANCAVSGESLSGAEVVLIGGADGNVYLLESGTSFNGAPLHSFLRTVLYHSNSPGRFKKYTHARLDAQLAGALTLTGQVEYDFNLDDLNIADPLDFSAEEAGGFWDDFTWDAFTWDSRTSGIPQQKLEGEGINAAVFLHSEETTDAVHVLRGMLLQWLPRRHDRRDL